MRHFRTVALLLLLLAALSIPGLKAQDLTQPIASFFNPRTLGQAKTIREVMLDLTKEPQQTLYIMTDRITDDEIGDALVAAKTRVPSLDLRVVMDANNTLLRGSQVAKLLQHKIRVAADPARLPAENDFASEVWVLDGQTTVTGSFALTGAAVNNVENILVLRDPIQAARHQGHFNTHFGHALELHQ